MRAVLTERQTSDCDVKCRITPIMQDSTACFYLFRLYIHLYDNRSLDRAAKHYGRFTPVFVWRLCSSPEFPLYAYALSLELAALAMRIDVWNKHAKFHMSALILSVLWIFQFSFEYLNAKSKTIVRYYAKCFLGIWKFDRDMSSS